MTRYENQNRVTDFSVLFAFPLHSLHPYTPLLTLTSLLSQFDTLMMVTATDQQTSYPPPLHVILSFFEAVYRD